MRIIDITICSIDTHKYISGVNTWVRNFSLELLNSGHNPRLIILTIGKGVFPLVEFAKKNGIEFLIIQQELYPFAEDKVTKIIEIVKLWKPHFFLPGILSSAHFTIPFLRKSNIYSIVVLHSDDSLDRSYLEDFVTSETKYQADAVVSVSEYIHNWSKDLNDTVKRACIGCGAPMPMNTGKKQATNNLKVVYSGRLVQEQKRVRDVLNSFELVVNQFNNVECYFLGNGPEKSYLQARIKNNGRGRINLMGGFDSHEVQRELMKYDVLVLLSDYEGLPLAMLEAMACGLVVICLDIDSGVNQVIRHLDNGIIIKDRENSFVESINLLIEKPELLEKIGTSARETVIQEYSSKTSAKRWVNFLDTFPEKTVKAVEIPSNIDISDCLIKNKYGLSESKQGASKFKKIRNIFLRIQYEILGCIPFSIFDQLKEFKHRFFYLFNIRT
ncbi:glycosyltransferase family 4 protein [Reichenbachiella sp. MALMAid0571]|uniref:glycosyltransferase family 4 protein n=1 Tax=Reichenbachiella sp. MALMAid0571 TaxID=3143939 RepID=UPI0032DEDACA